LSGWLLDTNIISAFAPGRPPPPQRVATWFEVNTDALFLSAVTVAEVVAGIARLRRGGAAARSASLEQWFDGIVDLYGDRILPFDARAGRLAGEMTDLALARGHTPGFADTAIGAIAQARSLTVLTANLRHFQPLGVAVHDPFAANQ